MNVKGIVKEYLEKNGFDGLCNSDCSCGMGILLNCTDTCDECEPGHILNCKKKGCDGGGAYCITNRRGHDSHGKGAL